jgi:hypothetical protein
VDIFTTSNPEDLVGHPERALGRDTARTMREWDRCKALIPEAPHVFAGTAPEVSPPIWLYCPGGYDNQIIGMCVGKGTKNAAATVIRIPEGAVFDPNDLSKSSPPGPNVRLSGLYCYWNARNVHGGGMWGEGAVVAYSLDGAMKWGFIPEALWPDTSANQSAYSDRRPPTEAMRAEGGKHVIVHAARITSRAQYFDFLGQGLPIVDGIDIGTGFMRTADDGQFSLGGRTVGGHCTETVGYDRKRNRLYKRNSWAQWGARTDNPEFNSSDPAYGGNAQGYSNIGYCPLDQYEEYYLSDRALASGQTDAFVLSDVPGFDRPKLRPISNVEVFT